MTDETPKIENDFENPADSSLSSEWDKPARNYMKLSDANMFYRHTPTSSGRHIGAAIQPFIFS